MATRPVIVGGSPGCGKTTLCQRLTQLKKDGAHLTTDTASVEDLTQIVLAKISSGSCVKIVTDQGATPGP